MLGWLFDARLWTQLLATYGARSATMLLFSFCQPKP